MTIKITFKTALYLLAFISSAYLLKHLGLKEYTREKKCIDKGTVGSRYGDVYYYVTFQYIDDGSTRVVNSYEDASDYVHYEVGKKYLENNQKIIWK